MTERLAQLALIVAVMWWVTGKVLPAAVTESMQRAVRWLARQLVYVTWTLPVRRMGFVAAFWLWALGAAMAVTGLTMYPAPRAVSSENLVLLLKVWAGVLISWLLLRAIARFWFRPRSLPRRR